MTKSRHDQRRHRRKVFKRGTGANEHNKRQKRRARDKKREEEDARYHERLIQRLTESQAP